MREELLLKWSKLEHIMICLSSLVWSTNKAAFFHICVHFFFNDSLKQKDFLLRPPHSLNYPIALKVSSLRQVPLLLNARWRVKRKHIKSLCGLIPSPHWGITSGTRSLEGCSAPQLWGFLVLLLLTTPIWEVNHCEEVTQRSASSSSYTQCSAHLFGSWFMGLPKEY